MKKLNLSITVLSLIITSGAIARPTPENESTRELIEGKMMTSLSEMQTLGFNTGKTKLELWSGSYWPLFQGGLAVRYRDRNFSRLISEKEQSFEIFHDLFKKLPLYVYSGKENLLSPAEKYDLVVGDKSLGLTTYSWKNSQKEATLGSVPIWRGICDGFASAAQMMPRPVKSVVMNTPEGMPITFYPEDIKALGSLLYARAQENVIWLGKRCRSRLVSVFTGSCDETNPATLHLALTNRVGKMGKSFIADVSPGSEVWNYPVKSYDFTYYNVFTDEDSKDFKKAAEAFKNKGSFAHSSRRHPKTAYIVGVTAKVRYADMRDANTMVTDGAANDKTLEKEYDYDLELDANFNILGGESYSENLPDFVWAPNDGAYPLSEPEQTRSPKNAEDLVTMAKEASKLGQPLSVIIRQLFESAK